MAEKLKGIKLGDTPYEFSLQSSNDGDGALSSDNAQALGENSAALGKDTVAVGKSSFAQGDIIFRAGATNIKDSNKRYYLADENCEMAELLNHDTSRYVIINQQDLESLLGQEVILLQDGSYLYKSDVRYTEAHGTGSAAMGQGAVAYSRASKSLGYRTQAGAPSSPELLELRPEAIMPEFDFFKPYSTDLKDMTLNSVNKTITGGSSGENNILEYNQFGAGGTLVLSITSSPFSDVTIRYQTIGNYISKEEEGPIIELGVYSGVVANDYTKDEIHIPIDTYAKVLRLFFTSSGTIDITVDTENTKYYPAENVGQNAVAFGADTVALSNQSMAIGYATQAIGMSTLAAGRESKAIGKSSTAFGYKTISQGENSFTEGSETIAYGEHSHAEGSGSITGTKDATSETIGRYAHAEGRKTTAIGQASHSEGILTSAEGNNSHAEGCGTIALGQNQHVQGKYNIPDKNMAHIVGWGSSNEDRKNIHAITISGRGWFADGIEFYNPKMENQVDTPRSLILSYDFAESKEEYEGSDTLRLTLTPTDPAEIVLGGISSGIADTDAINKKQLDDIYNLLYNTFPFKIDGAIYRAEPVMTWYKWLNSIYNIDKFELYELPDKDCIINDNGDCVYNGNNIIDAQEVINPSIKYVWGNRP